jgi:hypothetical protein
MDNALFYAFSTIAQSLAAAIGLLAVFILYRLQSLNSELESITSMALQPYLLDVEIQRWRASQDYTKLLELINTTKSSNDVMLQSPYIQACISRLPLLIQNKKKLLTVLKFSLALTTIVIASSVGIIAITPILAKNPCMSSFVLTIGVLILFACFTMYSYIIAKSLSNA